MSVGRPRWTWRSTCSTACRSWDARSTSASPDPDGVGGSAPAPMIHAPRWPACAPDGEGEPHAEPISERPSLSRRTGAGGRAPSQKEAPRRALDHLAKTGLARSDPVEHPPRYGLLSLRAGASDALRRAHEPLARRTPP